MRSIFCTVTLMMLSVAAQAMPIRPLSAATGASLLYVQMNNENMGTMKKKNMGTMKKNMTCKQMMQMHRNMMGNKKKMSCKQMMRMHRNMMGQKS